jgi:predicted amidophosphoribosyltransferase
VVEAAAAFRHENVARVLLNSFKFRSGAALAPFLASLLLDRCGSVLTTGTLVPVPPSSSGLAIRGFDTAALLVAELLKLMPDAVSRPALLDRPPGSRQLGSNRRDRLNGGVGIVAVAGLEGPAVLVDDVMTTGSTLSASARALRQAGTTTVRAVTFTRRP